MGKLAGVVWDDTLLGYDMGADHPLNPVRLDLTMGLAGALGVLDGIEPVRPARATEDEVLRVHSAEYIAAVKAAPESPVDVGHGLGTPDNPVFAGMHEAASLVLGSSLAAAELLLSGETDRVVNIGGGLHHAMRDSAAGFCVYNDCVGAIDRLLDRGIERVAYVDTDVHHGDGVQAAFYDDPRVLTISLHQHPATLFPGTGYARELGAGDAYGMSVNLPLPPGTTDEHWLRAFHAVVPSLLRAFRPQVLVTQCGVDTHRDDPLAHLGLTVDGHRAIYQALRELAIEHGGRWLAVGGGGYQLRRVVPRSWTHLLATALDRDIPVKTALPGDWAQRLGVPDMTDGGGTAFQRWSGGGGDPVDMAVLGTRRAAFPLFGLDPDDPRD
ncbi:acetoin utilization protein AcuC [Kutzneria chonburiensis]|uniref:Acetoin utilization protein AcuC n=1 Tax=Kutzneria chonburiensis TaxID=1483604 RepID=A0ABV6MYI2_9PSEU|nr:acetoin utilization protein AcuC [Kutzneria chonburiensis]